MIKKKWIIFIVFVIAITLSACTGNSPNNNANDQISKGDSANTDTNQDTNQGTNPVANQDTNQDTNQGTNPVANPVTNLDTHINNTDTTTTVRYEDIKLTPEEVFNIYIKKYPNVKVNKLALDFERGSYVYEVEGYDDSNEYELTIDPLDGKVLKEERKQRDDNDTGEITIENLDKIPELIDKAIKDAGNSYKVDEWELKFENGQSIFEIQVVDVNGRDIEYKYNVNTMELIEKDQ